MRIFQNRTFAQFARKNRIPLVDLCEAVRELTSGLVHANLGAGVFKQRIARAGGGKSGGFRSIVFLRERDRILFVLGYAKSTKDNLDSQELSILKRLLRSSFLMKNRRSQNPSAPEHSSKSSAKGPYRSAVSEAVHKTAQDFHHAGVLDKKTMRQFDTMCLTAVKPLTPRQIARIRRKEDVSQAVFAHHLNVSLNLISQWERGEKKPSGASLKLLTLIEKKGLAWVA